MEIDQFLSKHFKVFITKFQYFCAIIFILNFLKLGCENFAYTRV